MNKIITISFLISYLFPSFSSATSFAEQKLYWVDASPKIVETGIYIQPNGPFAVMLFNEDATGSEIGVFLYEVGYRDLWASNKRFWQDAEWSTDVTAFTWSPNGKFLFVSTNSIYGTGYLYELSLMKRTYRRIIPDKKQITKIDSAFKTKIRSIDIENRSIEFSLEYYNIKENKPIKEILKYKIPDANN